MLRGTNFCSCSVKSKVLWNYVRFLFWIFKKHASKKAKFYENKPFYFQSWFFLIPSRHSPFYVLLNTFFVFMGYGKETSDWSECMSVRGLGDQLFLKNFFDVIMYVPSQLNANNLLFNFIFKWLLLMFK